MDLSTEKTIWRSRAQKKTRALSCDEERLHHFRRSALTNDTTEHMAQHEDLARERYYNELGVTAWEHTESAPASVGTRRETIEKQRRSRQGSLKALDEKIDRAWAGVVKGTGAQQIACLRQLEDAYEEQDQIRSAFRSTAAVDSDSASKDRKAALASSKTTRFEKAVSQNAGSAPSSQATKHRIIHHGDKLRRRSVTKPNIPRFIPTSMRNGPMRVRTSQSDNTFLLKRRRHRGNLVQKIRARSEPIFRKKRLDHYENVAGGSGKSIHPWQLNTSALPGRKSLPSTNRNARAQSVDPREGRVSWVQDEDSSVRKSLKSRTHSPGPRSSERLLQLRKGATHSQISDKSLQNRVTKRRHSSNESDRTGKTISMRLRSSMRRNTRSKKPDLPNGSETASRSKTARATDNRTVSDVSKEKLTITIPANTSMATSLRRYSQWPSKSGNIALVNLDLTICPDDSGALMTAHGCLFPARYNFSGIPGFDWICPVRSCRRCFQSQRNLGAHFGVRFGNHLNTTSVEIG